MKLNMTPRNVPGEVITFYSYKGGTGRTMALANVACLLANYPIVKRGVLMIDWDLEAPSLHRFFSNHFQKRFAESANPKQALDERLGLIDLFETLEQATPARENNEILNEDQITDLLSALRLSDYIIATDLPNLHLLKAGRFDEAYPSRVSAFRWESLFNRCPCLYRCLAERLANEYDYVLIDSRTGFTDIGSICTMYMPERLVVVFTPNRQSLTGVLRLVHKATSFRKRSDDLRPLLVFPLASRVEPALVTLYHRWRYGDTELGIKGYQMQFEQVFQKSYSLSDCNLETYFDEVLIQHVPEYAYGEEIAVLVEKTENRLSLTRSYENFCDRLVNLSGPWEEVGHRERQLRLQHQMRVRAIVITPDGRRAISTSADHTLKIWDLQTQNEIRTLIGHADEVRAVTVTMDGRHAVSVSFDATIKVWDLEGGVALRTLRGHKDGEIQGGARVRAVALTADGRRLISGSADHTIKVWELASGAELLTLIGHKDMVNVVAVTPDGTRVISGSDDKSLKVWELQSGKELRTLRGHTDYVLSVAMFDGGRRAISASFDHTLKVWELESGKELVTLRDHTAEVRAVAVSKDGKRAISASYDQTIKVWDLENYVVTKTFSSENSFTACDISPNGDIIVAGDTMGNVHFLQLKGGFIP